MRESLPVIHYDDDRRRKTKKKGDEAQVNNGHQVPATVAASSVVVVRSGNRRVTPTTAAADPPLAVERLLPNGDIYTGTFSGSVPHGAGKYLWMDGCMYEGEWRKGKASGRGKFSWPSGATFEGQFKSGRMDGQGTFTGPDGDTYVGSWTGDRKHGFGRKCYANGDFYEGAWRKNRQEGHGRYVWRNGNQYIGEWKNGVISGRGVLIWANGNRYDGQWENGVPKGSGVFTWPDGSCYIGNWSDYPSFHLNGTFYHGSGKARENFDSDCGFEAGLASRKRSSFDGGRGSLMDRNSNFPRICIWESDGEAGDITCDIVDNVEASFFYREVASAGATPARGSAGLMKNRNPCCFTRKDVKKPGQTISKGHKNYELMLNLQLGISYSVGKPISLPTRSLRPGDFDPREKFWTRFPPEGSKVTPPHQSAEFKWKDYCPIVFRRLRDLFGIDRADYMVAICGNDALRELSSPGKSGSIFYMTQDDRFMIKTVKKSEVKVLLRMLPSYYQHMSRYENSLVTKFFGVHCVKPVGGQKVRFIVMGNLFCSEYRIHKRFDLKGSSYGRITDKAEGEIDETTTLKDLDLNYMFHLQKSWYQDLIRQIDRDCEFLEAERIMDYSLLVGIHFRDDGSAEKLCLSPLSPSNGKSELQQVDSFLSAEDRNPTRIFSGRKPWIRLGANMPAWAEEVGRRSYSDNYPRHQSSGGDATPTGCGGTYGVILYFGIIDILQDYDISKKLEHAYKSLQVDSTSISAVDPKLYSKRFRDFIRKIFVEDKSL